MTETDTRHVEFTGDDATGALLGALDRPRLDQSAKLRSGARRVCAVWAAAGSGKTTFLRQQASSLLDAGTAVFWLSGLETSGAPDLIARLARERADACLFLDDLHLAICPESVLASISAAPAHVRAVLSGRIRPASGLSGLEADSGYHELSTADLAFSEVEIGRLARLRSLELACQDVALLQSRTGGWAAASVLALSCLEKSGDVRKALSEFTGDNRAVAGYLAAEVLGGLAPAERAVLAAAAVRPHIPLDLAVILSARNDAGAILQRLSRHNALVTEEDGGYSYHPVLLSFLKADSRRQDMAAARRQCNIAACWYAARDEAVPALELALEANSASLVSALIDRFGLRVLFTGQTGLLRRAVKSTDMSTLPALSLRLLLEAPDFSDTRHTHHLLARADRVIHAGPSAEKWVLVIACMKILADPARQHAAAACQMLNSPAGSAARDDNFALDLLASLAEAWDLHLGGRVAESQKLLDDVASSGLAAGFNWVFMTSTVLASRIAINSCDWDTSRMLDNRFIDKMDPPSLTPTTAETASSLLAWTTHDYLAARPIAAERAEALIEADPTGRKFALDVHARYMRALIRLDAEVNPRPPLRELLRLTLESGRNIERLVAEACVRITSLTLEIDGREAAMEAVRILAGVLGEDSLEAELSRYIMHLPNHPGTPAELRLLQALPAATHSWHAGAPISAWLLLADTAVRTGRFPEAHVRLKSALRLADRYGTLRPFLARKGEGATMLKEHLGRFGHLNELAATIVHASESVLPLHTAGAALIQPLTSREHEILLELPIHQSIADIAEGKMLSVNTIKTHLRKVYLKLGVADRSSAVLVAQQHGLL